MDAEDVNVPDKYGNTALHAACSASNTKNDRILQALLDVDGIDVTVCNADENTALHYFCQKYATVDCAQLGGRMLELGGRELVLRQNKNQETALHYAMFNQQFRMPMARFLLRATLPNTDKDDKGSKADPNEDSGKDKKRSRTKVSLLCQTLS